MAASGARRIFQYSSSSSSKTLFSGASLAGNGGTSPFAKKASKLTGLSPPKPSSSSPLSHPRLAFSRLPVELGGALTLMPLHSATSSALFTSLLSLHSQSWGCLSEGFATPL
ncbi:unnamed protein product [Linum tenue]|uniref:Protein NUCLEAR FUSION DEFECTIVE 6, chloroplastic/mitochondrial-like n=1 Tax=Linum tenue TaxID=586396 RepID=A0AAV0LNQ8_9ROSI|nr:unnamed protein product [Linum tenue]